MAACTYLRRGIAANPYIAEGLTGRTVLSEHLYWHASNWHGPEWAVDYLESAECDWMPQEIDFVDWVFNASPMLKERAEMMALHEGMTYEPNSLSKVRAIRRDRCCPPWRENGCPPHLRWSFRPFEVPGSSKILGANCGFEPASARHPQVTCWGYSE